MKGSKLQGCLSLILKVLRKLLKFWLYLSRGKGSSEATASKSAPEVVGSEALLAGNSSDPKAQVYIQTISSSPSSPSSSSSSTDLDDIPLSQRYKKPLPKSKTKSKTTKPLISHVDESIISISERRIEICNRLPADHPFQPPMVQALHAIPGDEIIEPSSSQPPSSDLPQPSSPSTLFSLEKHLGGEMSITPQKASKTVPKKTVLESQQPPSPIQEKEPEVHMELQIQQIETTPEQQSEPEPSSLLNQQIASDQPSSSSQAIIIQQPLPNILESEYIDNELLKISDEVKELVLLRKVPILSIHYEDQWMNLKKNASELLDRISQKCLRTQAMVLKRHLAAIHTAEKAKGPLLCLANAPFFSESEYVTRDAKIFQQMKQKLLTIQAETQAKDEEIQKMKQKTEVLEDVVSKQAEELKNLSERMQYLMEVVSKQAQP